MIDPAPITAWLILILTAFGVVSGVVAAIAGLWHWIAVPQLRAMVDQRVDVAELAASAAVGKAHARIDKLYVALNRTESQ